MGGLLQRVLTAIVFVIVMVGGLFISEYSYFALFTLIAAGCLWEFYGLILAEHNGIGKGRRWIGTLLGLIPFWVTTSWYIGFLPTDLNPLIVGEALLLPLIFLAFIYEMSTHSEKPFANLAYIITGIVYVGIPFALLNLIAFYDNQYQPALVFGLLLLCWTNDTAAYFVGSKIGKTPLLPRISPKKTWEGSLGGAAITLLMAWALYQFADLDISLGYTMILGVIVIIFGSLGDLVESMLKRSVKVKDTGTLLPGHGGLLDRFDAFIFLIPFAVSYFLLVIA
ncbi:MAG: phosphatidate cytidylyltransferase [Bacteroidota bacterium]